MVNVTTAYEKFKTGKSLMFSANNVVYNRVLAQLANLV